LRFRGVVQDEDDGPEWDLSPEADPMMPNAQHLQQTKSAMDRGSAIKAIEGRNTIDANEVVRLAEEFERRPEEPKP